MGAIMIKRIVRMCVRVGVHVRGAGVPHGEKRVCARLAVLRGDDLARWTGVECRGSLK